MTPRPDADSLTYLRALQQGSGTRMAADQYGQHQRDRALGAAIDDGDEFATARQISDNAQTTPDPTGIGALLSTLGGTDALAKLAGMNGVSVKGAAGLPFSRTDDLHFAPHVTAPRRPRV